MSRAVARQAKASEPNIDRAIGSWSNEELELELDRGSESVMDGTL